MSLNKRIGTNAYWLRKDAGLSQEAVAVRMGVSHSHFSAIENGRQNFTIEVLNWLAKALGVDPIALFELGGHPNRCAMRLRRIRGHAPSAAGTAPPGREPARNQRSSGRCPAPQPNGADYRYGAEPLGEDRGDAHIGHVELNREPDRARAALEKHGSGGALSRRSRCVGRKAYAVILLGFDYGDHLARPGHNYRSRDKIELFEAINELRVLLASGAIVPDKWNKIGPPRVSFVEANILSDLGNHFLDRDPGPKKFDFNDRA